MHYKNIQLSYTQWFFFKHTWNSKWEVLWLVSDIFWLRAELFLVHKEFEEKKKKTSPLDLLIATNPTKNDTSRFYVSEFPFFEVFGHKMLSD